MEDLKESKIKTKVEDISKDLKCLKVNPREEEDPHQRLPAQQLQDQRFLGLNIQIHHFLSFTTLRNFNEWIWKIMCHPQKVQKTSQE
ncbi:hypothetical protein O181_062679 [Austropuccinia psidii MF-1]|uniref:Uncharacterized protein n=1 Tax=Austropuccinia psidii MF-1 TaxID=1389203 RepID=A0A9Q3EKV0_9BASI|nr:hypothetical protein [Austropuccinia psidii MF-1]